MPAEERVQVEEVDVEETSEKPKKGLAILLIIIALVAVIQCVVLFVIFQDEILTFFEKEEEEPAIVTLYYPLEPMSVNLADKTQRHFLKATASLEYQDAELTVVMDERKAEIQSTIMEVLRSKTLEEINSVEETKLLAEEIVETLNEVFETEAFADVHFTDYLYQ